MDKIIIEAVLNGWKVKAGCQEVVFTDADRLCSELRAYLADPPTVQKRYLEHSVNAKWTSAPQPTCGTAEEGPIRDIAAERPPSLVGRTNR